MLVLAYLATRHDSWRGATMRLIATPEQAEREYQEMAQHDVLKDVRIVADVLVLDSGAGSRAHLSSVAVT